MPVKSLGNLQYVAYDARCICRKSANIKCWFNVRFHELSTVNIMCKNVKSINSLDNDLPAIIFDHLSAKSIRPKCITQFVLCPFKNIRESYNFSVENFQIFYIIRTTVIKTAVVICIGVPLTQKNDIFQ